MVLGLRVFNQRTGDGTPVLDANNGEELMHIQSGVAIVFGNQAPVSPGTLYISTKRLMWLSDLEKERGYAVDFLSVSLHAVSRDPEAYSLPCIYTQIEIEAGEDEDSEGSDSESNETTLDLSKITEMRLIPSDPTQLDTLFDIFCECAELNPEPGQEEQEEEHNWIFSADQMVEDAGGAVEWPFYETSANPIGYTNGDHQDLAHSVLELQIDDQRFEDAKETHEAQGFSKSSSSSPLIGFGALTLMEKMNNNNTSYFSTASAQSRRGSASGGGGGGGGRGRGSGGGRGGAPTKDRIDALGRLMTRILRHMASELNLDMRSDGYVKVDDLLKLNLKTFANVPLRSHTIDEIREAVRKDNKQRFSLLEENGELLIRANQGHSTVPVQSESLLQPILSAEEAPVCVHGTYKKNLESILQTGLKRMNRLHVHFASGLPADGDIISGMRRDVNVLIFLDVRKALEEGMKLYISDNKVILTEGFDGIVPIKYFKKIETWPSKQSIPF